MKMTMPGVKEQDRIGRGVLLAGGSGSRLYPITKSVNKHLLSVYDKPLIYYSLSALMLAGVRKIAVVTTPGALETLQDLLGDGSQFGISISFFVQAEPRGLSDALLQCDKFVDGQSFALTLGDNMFFSSGLTGLLAEMFGNSASSKVSILTAGVNDPHRFGVLERDETGNVASIVEKPEVSSSNRAVTGLYRFPGDAIRRVEQLKPSSRGELEVTDLLNSYIDDGSLFEVMDLPRGGVWFDAGTTESMYHATEFVKSYQEASGCRIGCPEEVALKLGWIDGAKILKGMSASQMKSPYAQYLGSVTASHA